MLFDELRADIQQVLDEIVHLLIISERALRIEQAQRAVIDRKSVV